MSEPTRPSSRRGPDGGGRAPRTRAEVHDGRGPVQAVRLEHGQVLGRVRIALLPVVTRHEGRVEVPGPRVRQFVDHPGFSHEPILHPGQ